MCSDIVYGFIQDRIAHYYEREFDVMHRPDNDLVLKAVERSISAIPSFVIHNTGPFELNKLKYLDRFPRNEIRENYQFRICALLHPKNPLAYATLTSLLYTGDCTDKSNNIGWYSLRDYVYLKRSWKREPIGILSAQLAQLLATYLKIRDDSVAEPSIANMGLVEIGLREQMATEPTLLFYMDVPFDALAWMVMNINQLLGLRCDFDDTYGYRLFHMMLPW